MNVYLKFRSGITIASRSRCDCEVASQEFTTTLGLEFRLALEIFYSLSFTIVQLFQLDLNLKVHCCCSTETERN